MTSTRLVLSALAVGAILSGPAASQPVAEWTIQFGSDSEETGGGTFYQSGMAGAPGLDGDLYTLGNTKGDFGGPARGLADCFVSHTDSAGNLSWAAHLGTKAEEDAGGAAPDGAGGVFVAGMTDGELGGPNAGKEDVFLARYENDGTLAWLTQFGSAGIEDCTGAAPDGHGGVFVGGMTSNTLFGDHIGNQDAFLARFDHDGQLVWGLQFGSKAQELIGRIASDGEGGVLICGTTWGKLVNPPAEDSDAFAARFDAHGNLVWLLQFSLAKDESAQAVASDSAGGAFVAGSVIAYFESDPHAFVARIDAGGAMMWNRPFSLGKREYCSSLIPDREGGAIVGGLTSGDQGDWDGFIARFSFAGDQEWLEQFGTPKSDGASVAESRLGGFFVVGGTSGVMAQPDQGGSDVYVTHYLFPGCKPDCDASGDLSLFDFLCFVNLFNSADTAADCDGNGLLDLFDFLCFTNAFNAGC